MGRYLTEGEEIKLKGIDGHYIIKDIIGRGSSCVVYSTEFYNTNGERTEHLLKEFNPRCIDIKRENGKLVPVKDGDNELFEALCEHFKNGFDRQSEFRSVPELKNYTANIQNIYRDNGTIYIDMTETNGESYATVKEKSIFNLAQRIRVLAQVIGNYHKHGYLHLDIKPSNIFVRPEDETCQDVLLFDFDSLVSFSEESGKCLLDETVSLSFTTEYAPIELLNPSKRTRICKATDIYEIGEIFFEKLMGRHSTALEHNVLSDYEYDTTLPIFENVNPKVLPLLDELFMHTLCNDVSMRYQATEELIAQFDKIVEFSNPEKPFLKTSLSNASGFFTGRDAEIEEIHKRLQENNILFLSGIGGIGKSELAKHYAKAYESEYDTIIFAPFVNDIQMMITNDNYVPIYYFSQYPEEKPEEYFARKMRKLGELCDERTLIIVDNLDTTEDDNFEKLISLNCKMLITTRRDFSDIYANSQLDLGTLENPFIIFNEHYKKPLSEEEKKCVDEIVEIVCGHTMTVELLAKQMMAGRVMPEKMLEKLKNGGISESGKEKVFHSNEKGVISRENTYGHIQALFDLSGLDEDEKYVLANLSLIPHTGISTELFGEWCEIENFDTINNLVMKGWVRWDREKDYISLHPLLSELIFHILNNIESLTSKYISNTATIKFWGNDKITDKHYVVDVFKHSLLLIDKYNFRSESAADFLRKVSTRIEHYEIPANIERYYKKALAIRLELFGESSGDVATSYLYLAKLYDNVGKFSEAEKYAQMALKVRESIYGTRSDHYMLVLFELGHILAWQERYAESETAYLQVEQYFMEAYDEETKTVLNCKLHLGDLYSRMKQYDKAIEVLQNCLTKKQLKYGADSLDSATVHYSLSVAYRNSEKIELSIDHGEKALSIRLLKLNENHPSIAQSYSSLGMTYLFFNEFDKAEEYLLRALEIRKKIFGEEHQRTARVYYRLGLYYEKIQKHAEAIKNFDIATKIWINLLMFDYPDKLEAEQKLLKLRKTQNDL